MSVFTIADERRRIVFAEPLEKMQNNRAPRDFQGNFIRHESIFPRTKRS